VKRTATIFLLVLLAACATTVVPAHDEAGVRAAMTGFLDALNALDADAMAGYFADDVTAFVPIAQPQRANGKAEVAAIFRDFAAQTRKTTPRINIKPDHVLVQASGDFGLVSFETIPGSMLNRRTFVFRRIGGRWLIVHIHASNLPAHP
jgi:uncharacterized protein (TIGR02246 family)